MTQDQAVQLTAAINSMSERLLTFKRMTTNPPLQEANQLLPPPPPPTSMQPPNPSCFYPKLVEVCRSLYMDCTDIMSIETGKEWLKTLQIHANLNRCAWLLKIPTVRPDGVMDSEEEKLKEAIIDAFQLCIPAAVRVSLPIDVDNPDTFPAVAYITL